MVVMIKRSLTLALLGCLSLSACIVVERRPADDEVPAWQRPGADADRQQAVPRGPMPRTDLRLSEFQAAPPAAQPRGDVGPPAVPAADDPWSADAWNATTPSVDSGIYPNVFPAATERAVMTRSNASMTRRRSRGRARANE